MKGRMLIDVHTELKSGSMAGSNLVHAVVEQKKAPGCRWIMSDPPYQQPNNNFPCWHLFLQFPAKTIVFSVEGFRATH